MHLNEKWLSVIDQWDCAVCLYYRQQRGRMRFWDGLMGFVARYGPVFFFVEMGFLLVRSLFQATSFGRAVAGVFIAIVSAVLTKLAIDGLASRLRRPRPFVALHFNPLIKKDATDPSFPSNHAGGAFALAVALSLFFPYIALISYVLATVVTFSRLYAGLHYLTDVLIGAMIGTIFAVFLSLVL